MAQDMQDAGNVSAELDAMVCDLIGAFLDDLAAGENPGVVVAIEDAASNRYLAALRRGWRGGMSGGCHQLYLRAQDGS